MELLHDVFFSLLAEYSPTEKSYRELRHREQTLYTQLSQRESELLDDYLSIASEREYLDCQAFFHQGIRLGLELLRL